MRDRIGAVISGALLFIALVFLCVLLEIVTHVINPDRIDLESARGAPWKTGSSFRYKMPALDKEKGEFRILVLGDSFSWGDGISDPALIWPSMLEKDMRSIARGNVSVINMAVCGFTTVNELEILVRAGAKYRPDIVLIQYYINDVLPSGTGLARIGEDYLDRGKRVNLFGKTKIHDYLAGKSYFYVFLNNRFLSLQRRIFPSKKWQELYADGAGEWQAQKKALFWIGQWSAENKVPAVLVMFPVFKGRHVTADNFEYKDIYELVGSTAESYGIKVLDLLPFYSERDGDFRNWTVSGLDAHPNAKAHRLAATAVSDYLINMIKARK